MNIEQEARRIAPGNEANHDRYLRSEVLISNIIVLRVARPIRSWKPPKHSWLSLREKIMPQPGELRRVKRIVKIKAPNGNNVNTEIEVLQQWMWYDNADNGTPYGEWVDVPLADEGA